MTRERAMAIWRNVALKRACEDLRSRLRDDLVDEMSDKMAEDDIDGFVALGMLKLDEPKSVNERAVEALFAGSQGGMITPRHALDALSAANLKIVEK